MPDRLLNTKFTFPLTREQLVARPRLLERLDHGLRGPLTLVSAPAGSGKTTLLSAWRTGPGRGCAVAWLSLDPGDNDLLRFLAYIAAAFEPVRPGLCGSALLLLKSPQPPSAETVLTALVNDLSSFPGGLVLALDDYHHISDPGVHQAVAFLFDHLPVNFHLAILTRVDPPLPLARLRVRNQLVEIRAADLLFTLEETADFISKVMGIPLSAEDIAALAARTEGWIAGVQLASLALQALVNQGGNARRLSEFVQAFQGSHHYVVDYLVEEVLNRQPEAVRIFLLHTSILDWMSGPLCDALMRGAASAQRQDGQAMLEALEQANLFVIRLDDEGRWFRYHTLFGDLLVQRLRQTSRPEVIATLHARAAAWLEGHSFPGEAVHHLLEAGNLERAESLIEQHAMRMIYRGEAAQVLTWLKALPEDRTKAHPALCLAFAWAVYFTTLEESREKAEEWLVYAGLAHAAHPQRLAAPQAFDANRAALRAYLAFNSQNDPQAVIDHASQALANLSIEYGWIRSALTFLIGQARLAQGQYAAASQALTEASRLGAASDSPFIAYASAYLQSVVLRERGELRQALETCRDMMNRFPQPSGWANRPVPGTEILSVVRSSILLEWNELEQAGALLRAVGERESVVAYQFEWYVTAVRLERAYGRIDSALERVEQAYRRFKFSYFHALRAQIWLAQVEEDPAGVEKAAAWAQERGVTLERGEVIQSIVPLLSRDVERLTLARLMIAQRRFSRDGQPDLEPVLRFLEHSIAQAEAAGWLGRTVELHILRALALDAAGETGQGLFALEQALALAEPRGYALIFLEEGPPLGRLLQQAAQRRAAGRLAIRLLGLLSSAAMEVVQPLVEPLSPRELEVLRLVASGCSNQEIAGRLVISLLTVKRHMTNIFGKLGVRNRTEAASRAREIGLL